MGKRATSLKGGVKSKGSHKTKKRLEIKHAMLAAKASPKKNPSKTTAKKKVVKK